MKTVTVGSTGAAWLVCLLLISGCAAPQLQPREVSPTLLFDPARMVLVTLANPSGAEFRLAGSSSRGYSPGAYGVSAQVQGAVLELVEDYGVRAVDAWPIALLGVHCVVFEAPAGMPRTQLLLRLAADARVESAQAFQQFSTASRSPVDARALQYSDELLKLEQAHRLAQGRGVRVAIVDTGADYDHPQLASRVSRHLDFVGQDDSRFRADRHGTAVAGVIAAAEDEHTGGMLGVAPQALLLVLKACWSLAPGSAEAACNTLTLARAIAAAVELRADIINLSLVGPTDPLLSRLVAAALSRGALVVGAAPEGEAAASGFPTAIDGVLPVRSSGARIQTTMLAAPGEDIISTAPDASYELQSGSSLAAAHVSGVAALVLERKPGLQGAAMKSLLQASSVVAGGTSGLDTSIDACAALSRAIEQAGCAVVGPESLPP